MEPYSANSVQSGKLWQKIADNLNSVQGPHFSVNKRVVQQHIGILIQRFKRQEALELKESGMSPEHTELDAAVEQIIAVEESGDNELPKTIDEKKEKLEADRRKVVDMQGKAMETIGKTQKQKSDQGRNKQK